VVRNAVVLQKSYSSRICTDIHTHAIDYTHSLHFLSTDTQTDTHTQTHTVTDATYHPIHVSTTAG